MPGAQPVPKLPCDGTLVGGFFPELTWFHSCCEKADLSCTGCGFWANGECEECAPGFAKQAGVCEMCDDVPGWEDDHGMTCNDYERLGNCSEGKNFGEDLPFKGLRASQACCACGGGELSPTPWRYPVNNEVLTFGQEIGTHGRPLPGTARRHEVQEDCDLAKLGLSLASNGSITGRVPGYQAGDTGLSASCAVTAVQDEMRGLESETEVRVTVQPMSYGNKVIVIRFPSPTEIPSGQQQWPLQMAPNLGLVAPLSYEATCMPSAPWIAVDPATGTLSYVVQPHAHGAGLSGEKSGFESTQCMLEAKGADGRSVRSGFVVMKVFLWAGAYYPQTVFARKNRPIAGMQLWRHPPEGFEAHFEEETGRVYWIQRGTNQELLVPPAERPEVQGVKCLGAPAETPVKWSKRTGLVTVGGQAAFVVDPKTGDISGVSKVDLPARLGRASLTLSCAVALSGELYDYTMTVRLGVQIEDDTCWYESACTDSVWSLPVNDSSKPCSLHCQARADCGMYWFDDNNTCMVQTSSDDGTGLLPEQVHVRSSCEEGVSCLMLMDSGASFLEGKYCPKVRQMINRCFRPTYYKDEVLSCSAAGFIMYSMRLKRQRFGSSEGQHDGHFVCVYSSAMKWYTGGGTEFIPESTDVLVASVDPTANMVVSLEGVADVFEGVRKGYSAGDLAFAAQGPSVTAITGKGFQAWECGDISTAVFSRDGINAWDELYMARGPCPIHGRGGNWVVRRANETDYMNPNEGTVELRGEVLACIDLDIEREAFRNGVGKSTMWMPDAAFTQEYYSPQKLQNNASELLVKASLITDTCPPPEMVEDSGFLVGTTQDPDFYSLDPCECFGEAYRQEEVVADDSRKAVTRDPNRPFNHLHPEPQLLVEGPYACEDSSVLVNGQINEVSEAQCSSECYGTEGCKFFNYVPQLRFCTLHEACDRLGHTGLDMTHLLFGVFGGGGAGGAWCRIADPEACWAKKHRRALLAGRLRDTDEPCAFQHVVAQCDALEMVTQQAHGTCKKCEYYPITSEPAAGLVKRPMPQVFPGGAQLTVSCGTDSGLMSLISREKLDSSVLTCVGGKWWDKHGYEGFSQLACVDPVQVSQPSYNKLLLDSIPETYFLSKRRVQYHHGVVSGGCHQANEHTQAPLRTRNGDLCLEAVNGEVVARESCNSTFFLTVNSALQMGGPTIECLRGNADLSESCSFKWHLDMVHRLRSSNGHCLKHGGSVGAKPFLEKCSESSFPPEEEQWYFDGGDCRYTMELRGAERPLTWKFQLHGGAVLGSQTKASEMGSSAEELLDPMAYGTCKTNLKGALTGEDKHMRDVLSDLAPAVDEIKGVRGMMYTMSDSTLFVCSPGGDNGPEMIAQYQDQVRKKTYEDLPRIRRECAPVRESWAGCRSMWRHDCCHQNLDGGYSQAMTQINSWAWGSRRRRRFGIERHTQVCFKRLHDVRIVGTYYRSWYGWHHSSVQCPAGWVVTGLHTKWIEENFGSGGGWRRRRRRNWRGLRRFDLRCGRLMGHNPHMNWNAHHMQWFNNIHGYGWQRAPQGKVVVGMAQTGLSHDDRRFKLLTVDLCRTKTDKVRKKEEEIRVLQKKIEVLSKTVISCAKDLELPVNAIPEIGLSYVGSRVGVTMEVDVRCHLLHRGHDEDDEQDDYTLTAAQFTDIARAATYHAVGAGNASEPPFFSAVPLKDAQNLGWFTLIDNGATVWGIYCDQGSVVAVHGEVASPHCVSVGAGTTVNDLVLSAIVPGSGQCELGYAIAGWYNLPGVRVHGQSSRTGGPTVPTGYTIRCREVPGLSRLCEEKESRCERDEVVTGITHELGLTVKYRCCKLPKNIGYVFADQVLTGLKPWEGYYCPTGLDETGRPEYAFCGKLGSDSAVAPRSASELIPRASDMADGVTHKDWQKHEVACKGGELLNQFRVEKTGHVRMDMQRASFTCSKLSQDFGSVGLKPTGCKKLETNAFSVSSLQDFFTDVAVMCPFPQDALAAFQLRKEEGSDSRARYHYLCCDAFLGEVRNVETQSLRAQNFADLGKISVTCMPHEVMKGFKQVRRSDRYGWTILCASLAQPPPLPDMGNDTNDTQPYNITWDKFKGVWKLWDGSDFEEPLGALASKAEVPEEASHETAPLVRIEPDGFGGNEGGPRFFLDKLEVKRNGSGWNVVVLMPGARKVDESRRFDVSGSDGAAARGDLVAFLNNTAQGRVVLVSFSWEELLTFTGEEWYQFQRCGSTFHMGQRPNGTYSFVGIVGGKAVVESDPDAAIEVEIPQLSVAPIVDFTAAFVMTIEQPDPFPKHRPLKPKLLHFSPKKPEYDQFCDLKTRNEKMEGIDCEGEPDSCPEDEHPCAHTYKNKITEQVFWDCQQRDIDRDYLTGMADANAQKLDAEGAKLDFIFDLVEAGVSLAAAAVGAIPWGSFAVPAEEGADAAVEGTEAAAEKVVQKTSQAAMKGKSKAAQKTMKARMKRAMKKMKENFDLGDVGEWVGGAMKTAQTGAASKKKGKRTATDAAYVSGKTKSGSTLMLDDDTPAIPDIKAPDMFGFNDAKNTEMFERAGWLDCNPVQYGLSKMMCDLYCIEDAVKEGDSVILKNMRTSHTILMTNIERLLDYHTQTLLWGMGQLRDQLMDTGTSNSLLFFPGKADWETLSRGKLPEDITEVLGELNNLPQLVRMDLPANASLSPEAATWHQQASHQLLASLHRTLERNLKPGGDVRAAAKQAKEQVQRFSNQTTMELGTSLRQSAPPLAKMTQDKAAALRGQLRSARESLEALPSWPPVKSLESHDAAVMAWYTEVSAGFVTAHERHAAFVQSRQRALRAAESAVSGAESYVGCGNEDMKELHGLWQRAYRLEDQAAKDLLDAWTATTSAQERLTLAVQEGLVDTLAEKAPLPLEAHLPCGALAAVAESGHALAVKALDKALWPLLEQVLALERLAGLQEQELKSKDLSHVQRLPVNDTIVALYLAARDGANPESAFGRHLAARALDAYGPAACPAPASCRAGGMLLLNSSNGSSGFFWTSTSPGDLLLGKKPEQVAHACSPGGSLLAAEKDQAEAATGKMLQEMATVGHSMAAPGRVLQQVSATGATDSVLSAVVSSLGAVAEELKELKSEVGGVVQRMDRLDAKIDVDSHLCTAGCAERLHMHLSKKRSAVSQVIARLR